MGEEIFLYASFFFSLLDISLIFGQLVWTVLKHCILDSKMYIHVMNQIWWGDMLAFESSRGITSNFSTTWVYFKLTRPWSIKGTLLALDITVSSSNCHFYVTRSQKIGNSPIKFCSTLAFVSRLAHVLTSCPQLARWLVVWREKVVDFTPPSRRMPSCIFCYIIFHFIDIAIIELYFHTSWQDTMVIYVAVVRG